MRRVLIISILFSLQSNLLFSQSNELDTLNRYELEKYFLTNCCANKQKFLEVFSECIRRIKCKEHVSNNTIKYLIQPTYKHRDFLSTEETIDSIKTLMNLDYSYDKHLKFEVFSLILSTYGKFGFSEKEKEEFMKDVFDIREYFYRELVQFEDFNRRLSNIVRGMGDTVLFKRFNGDVLYDVEFSTLKIGDKPINVVDQRVSGPMFQVQEAAFWDMVSFSQKLAIKKNLKDLGIQKTML